MIKLSANNLSIKREKNGASFSLHVPHLELQAGNIVAVLGQSGCGKSTLLDMLALILRPHEGEMKISRQNDKETNLIQASASALARVRSKDFGYVLQSGGLFPFLSARENILLPAQLLGLSSKIIENRFRDLTETLGIAGQVNKKPQYLSGGQRQRVAIARALIHSPPFVLADEPTAAVDSTTAENICEIFREVVSNSGSAAIIVSHDRELIEKYVDAKAEFEVKTHSANEVHSTLHWPKNIQSNSFQ